MTGALSLIAAPTITAQQPSLQEQIIALPDQDSLRDWHTALASEPHRAGTPGDAAQIQRISDAFTSLGLEVEVHEFWAYLSEPISASLTILGDTPIELPLREEPLDDDLFSQNESLTFGWNAYAATGTAQGRIIYANHATKSDFEHLANLGIDCTDAIIIARYGGNFRGYKALYAQQAGAAGLIIYTDPKDAGYAQGTLYPEGGWANPTTIQRGSILTMPYVGDPLTPFLDASEDAQRVDPATVLLPTIPVQPIGWGAAQQILERMTGTPIDDQSWQGGLPFPYRITGGDNLRVRLSIEQKRSITKTANIIATLRGSQNPEQRVIVGCHHDAWEYGAQDPTSGLTVVMEAARTFAALRDAGWQPKRSISFAAWGAEEFGIIGSAEWVEKHADDLSRNTIAYINLDAAVSGNNFRANASPSLKPLIMDVTKIITDQLLLDDDETQTQSIFDRWLAQSTNPDTPGIPSIGTLGGGSDHVGFYCHLGIPSTGLSFRGAKGHAYHSNYDNLAWYRKVVGNDYNAAATMTQIVSLMLARLADDPIIPLNATRLGPDISHHLQSLEPIALSHDISLQTQSILASTASLILQADRTAQSLLTHADTLSPGALNTINTTILSLDRLWLDPQGLPDRPWFRNTFAATDPTSGYAAWALPALRAAIESGDQQAADTAIRALTDRINAFRSALKAIELLATPEN